MNPILQKIEDGILAKVTPENKQAVDKAIIAGMEIMFNEKTHANMELVKNPQARKDIVKTVGVGISNLMWLMYKQSKNTMKEEVIIMAGIVLMCKALDFAEQAYGVEITNDVVSKTTKLFIERGMEKLGIDTDSLQGSIDKNTANQQDSKMNQQDAVMEQKSENMNNNMANQGIIGKSLSERLAGAA